MVVEFPEEQAEFPGGVDSLFSYINGHFELPLHLRDSIAEGRIFVRFVIYLNGEAGKPEIVRTFIEDRSLDRHIKDLILNMPKWIPGKVDGKAVNSHMILPIRIKR